MRQFSVDAETKYYESGVAEAPDPLYLSQLAADMRLWIPGFPEVFRHKRVLDVAAGTGANGAVLARQGVGAKAISLDLVFHRIQAARKMSVDGSIPHLVTGDCFRLPFDTGTFDLAIGNSILHHLAGLPRAIAEIGRVLKPGGMYLGREPNFDNPGVRIAVFRFGGTWLFPGTCSANEYPLRAREIRKAFEETGFKCALVYFWRRIPGLRHRVLSPAISVRAIRTES